MFAYCGNNPVVRVDPYGYSWFSDFLQIVKDWLEERKEEGKSNEDHTETVGVTGSAAFGVAASGAVGITRDNKGNIGIALSINIGGGFPSVGAGGYKTTTNAPNIYKQSGHGVTIGASGGPGVVAAGMEYNMLIDQEESCVYHGNTVSATYGFYPTIVEVHGEVGYTWVWGVNVYDVGIELVDLLIAE